MNDFFKSLLANDLSVASIFFTLLIGFILSLVIGLEREYRQQIAGLRTHILICLGSVVFTLMARLIILRYPSADASRIPSTIVSGIGFIAAGAIIKLGFTVKGVTTIASIWSISSIGIAVGMGEYAVALIATGFVLFTLIVLGWIGKRFFTQKNYHNVKISGKHDKDFSKKIFDLFYQNNIPINNMSVEEDDKKIKLNLLVQINDSINIKELADSIHSVSGIDRVEIE